MVQSREGVIPCTTTLTGPVGFANKKGVGEEGGEPKGEVWEGEDGGTVGVEDEVEDVVVVVVVVLVDWDGKWSGKNCDKTLARVLSFPFSSFEDTSSCKKG